MKVCVLASGSKGNSTYIENESTHILIDLGMSSLYVEKNLKELGIHPKTIDGIIITHTHTDHINGLRVFIKKYHPTLYVTEKMFHDINEIFPVTNYVLIDKEFSIKDLDITPIKISHDASDTNGYVVSSNNKSVVYITDTGYINVKNHKKLLNKNIYIMESNHDIEMLMEGRYPYHLKRRVAGSKGHLSNIDSSNYLLKFIGENTHDIVLAHLSEENNTPEKALECLRNRLQEENKSVENIMVAHQNEKTELIEV